MRLPHNRCATATFGSGDGAPGHSPQEQFNARWLCHLEA